MIKILKANLERGKKWLEVRRRYEFEHREKDLRWIDGQKSISQDIKDYKEYLESTKEKEFKETKSKKVK